MSENLIFRFDVLGNDFTSAGQASVQMKKNLRQLGFNTEVKSFPSTSKRKIKFSLISVPL